MFKMLVLLLTLGWVPEGKSYTCNNKVYTKTKPIYAPQHVKRKVVKLKVKNYNPCCCGKVNVPGPGKRTKYIRKVSCWFNKNDQIVRCQL